MSSPRLERRAFLTIMGRVLAGTGVLAAAWPGRASARPTESKVFEEREVSNRAVAVSREEAWSMGSGVGEA